MKIVVDIAQNDIIQAISESVSVLLRDKWGDREPHQVISDAIRDGVTKAISQTLTEKWGNDLQERIAEQVAKKMASR